MQDGKAIERGESIVRQRRGGRRRYPGERRGSDGKGERKREREEREKEREIIQLHRLCSRSQTIRVCKEQKRRKKREKEKNCKEGKTR